MAPTKSERSPRDRLLAAADELFYREGVHTVGIDRVIERAGVAKASLYSSFGSKEELVRAYLQQRADVRQERITSRLAQCDTPRARILAVFELLAELVARPTFRGCAFVNASAEGAHAEGKVGEVCSAMRGWTRHLFVELATQFGASQPEQMGRQLSLLYDGVLIGASMDRDPSAASEALRVVELLLAQHAAPPSDRARASKAKARKPGPQRGR